MIEYVSVAADDDSARTSAIKLHGSAGFDGMRKAGRVTASVLDALNDLIVPGTSTQAIDDFARRKIEDAGAIAANIGPTYGA